MSASQTVFSRSPDGRITVGLKPGDELVITLLDGRTAVVRTDMITIGRDGGQERMLWEAGADNKEAGG